MKKRKIAFLGPNGAFTHETASILSVNLVSYCSIPSIMNSVVMGKCSKGIVPIENSIEGSSWVNFGYFCT